MIPPDEHCREIQENNPDPCKPANLEMKLVVSGATGFVATEVIRQSLRIASITSVVALSRRPFTAPEDADADVSKLKCVVLEDFGVYPDSVQKELEGVDACIWPLAITPTKSKTQEWETVRRVCHDYTMVGLDTLFAARNWSRPFRFMYVSGIAAERDQSKTPQFMPEYCLMRGEVENRVLAFESEHKGQIEVCVTKPGMIRKPGFTVQSTMQTVASSVGVPSVQVAEIAAAMIEQVLNGFEKETLSNDDLVRLGQKALQATPAS